MAEQLTTPESVSIANGVIASFATVWPFEYAAEVKVTVDGVARTEGVHYDLSAGDWLAAGANVVFRAGSIPVDGARVVRQRVTLAQQLEPFGDQQTFRPQLSEKAYDRLTRAVQDLQAKAARAIAVPPGESSLEVPSQAVRDGGLAVFEGAGLGVFQAAPGQFLTWGPDGRPVPSNGTGADFGLRIDLAGAAGAALIGVAGGGSVQDIIDGMALTPERFGAVGDGVADDWQALQDCFDAAKAQRRGVRLGRMKKYRYTQKLTFRPTNWNPLNIPGASAFAPSIDLSGESPLTTALVADGVTNDAALVIETGHEPQFTIAANLTNGSPVITGVADTSGVLIGALIDGLNIDGTVLSKTANTITVSANATATVAAEVCTVSIFRAVAFTSIKNLSLVWASGAGASGLRLRSAFNSKISRVVVLGFPVDNIRQKVEDGDYDGSVYTSFEDVWTHNAGRWGMNALSDAGKNEQSFLSLTNFWIQNCGNPAETFKAVPNPLTGDDPQSGGMIFKGQNLIWKGGGWTICKNVGFYAKGDSGIGFDFHLQGLSAENTGPRQILSTGCEGGTFQRVHFYNNNLYPATVLAETYSGVYPCNNFRYEDCRVRATVGAAIGGAGQPLTAFKNTRSASNHPEQIPIIDGLRWQAFGWPGQIGFAGDWNFGGIPKQAFLSFAGQVVTLLPDPIVGGTVPLAVRSGGAAAVNFETGHVVPHIVRPTGYALDTTAFGNGIFNAYLADNLNVVTLLSGPASGVPSMVHGIMRRPDITGYTYMGRFARAAGALLLGAAANWLNPTWMGGAWHWSNAADKAMMKPAPGGPTYASLPSSDTDGTLIGTQS